MSHQLQLRTHDIYLLSFPSNDGDGSYTTHAVSGTDETVLSTPSESMFQGWVAALKQAQRPFTILGS